MASPFSMLSMLSRRRQAAKRTESTTSVTSESSTATLSAPSSTSSTSAASAAATLINSTSPSSTPALKRRDSISSLKGIPSSPPKASISPPAATKDTSDTASIRSGVSATGSASGTQSQGGTLRKATLLSRFSSGAVETLASALGAGYTPPPPTSPPIAGSRPATPSPAVTATPSANAEASRPPTPPSDAVLAESPKMQTADLKSLSSDEGFFDGASDAGKDAVPASTSTSLQANGTARRESSASTTASGVLERKRSSLEAVIVQNAVDKQMIKKLEEEKAVLEKEKTALAEDKDKVVKEKETLLKEVTDLEEGKAALEKEKASLTEAKAALEREKAALAQQNATLSKNLKDREAQWEAERHTQSSTIFSFETRLADLQKTVQDNETKWDGERRNLEATFEAEKNWLEGEIKQMVTEWEVEKETDRKNREEELALVERDNDSLTKRVAELEVALKETKETKEGLENEVVELQQEKVDTIALIDALKNDISLAMEDIERMHHDEEVQKRREETLLEELESLRAEKDAEIATRNDRIDLLAVTLKEARGQHDELRKISENKIMQKEQAIDELKDQMSAYYQYVDETDRRNRLLCDQLKRQSMELRFATPTETKKLLRASGATIESAVRLMNHFNSEAFQAAASFADNVEAGTFLDFSGVVELEPLEKKLAPIMGREMVRALRASYTNSIQDPDTLLLQIAFQACVTYCANRFIGSWYPFEWEHGDFLQILHGRILDAGKKDAANSWRSTTKSLLNLTSEAHPQMLAYLREYIYDVLAVVGRSPTQPAVEALIKASEEKLSLLSRLAIRLHILLFDDDVTNGALAPYVALPESDFVHEYQEDNYSEGGGNQSEVESFSDSGRVLCTTELGLQKVAGSGEDSHLVLLKPKVALSTVLNSDW
ncbi:hypothetical protein BKA70DRAFT_1560775 [Coprinopsis sp. MPI-PUGE-AT-0042]|nr:hypothetical protein BKA70DRAFT_1560775 [Coprinopsis sp. MPI-PUGE-AT-0042]